MKAVTDSFCFTEPTETEAAALAKLTGPSRECASGGTDGRKYMYDGWMLWDPNNTYTTSALAQK